MNAAIEGCHHLFPCADPLTHARKIAALPEPLPVGTPKHREWQDARNRVLTAQMQAVCSIKEDASSSDTERLIRTTPDSRIRADYGLPPGVPTREQAGHLVDQMTPELRAEMEAYWARAEPYDTTDRHLGPMTHRPAAKPNFIFAREDFMQKLASATSEPIDTSTTAGKIAVMQQFERDEHSVECKARYEDDEWSALAQGKGSGHNPGWNWADFDYRIAPPPAPRTALQAARECRSGMTTVDVTSPAGRLCALLRDIENSIEVNIEGPPGRKKSVHRGFADLSVLTPGRYRLLRDDA